MADHLSLTPKTISVSLVLLGVVLYLPFSTVTGGDTANCFNPPPVNPNPPPIGIGNFPSTDIPGNPNPCHLYKWNHFPNTRGVTPNTGLFNNDTSYYFSYNLTSVIGFSICVNVQEKNINEPLTANETLTLQYYDSGLAQWANIALGSTAGSVSIGADEPDLPGINCSPTVGPINTGAIFPVCLSVGANQCTLRIAGNLGVGGVSAVDTNDFIVISNLVIQFYYSTAFTSITDTITCNANSRSLTTFTNTCTMQIPRAVTTTITVAWRATNSTGVGGCGVADNCWRPTGNPGSLTCTIAIAAVACVNSAIAFAPAFTTTTPIVIENWSPTNQGIFSIAPQSSAFPLLT